MANSKEFTRLANWLDKLSINITRQELELEKIRYELDEIKRELNLAVIRRKLKKNE